MRILLIEDDPMIGKAMWQGLVDSGFAVDWVMDGRTADASLAAGVYDLAILDLGLPQKDGLAVLHTLRSRGNGIPVLIVSARGSVPERIAGLEAGADDYLFKPFDLDELVARARVLVRRRSGTQLTLGKLVLDSTRRVASLDGQPLNLSLKQFAILNALMENAGKAQTRTELEAAVYGAGDEVESNALEVHMHHLRKKLGSGVIKTVRGVGYVIS